MLILFDLFSIAFCLSLVLTPIVRDLARKRGWLDRPDRERKLHAQPVPRLGGVAIAISYVLACGFVLVAPYRSVPFDLPTVLPKALALLPAAGLVFLVGLLDDFLNLKAWQKLTGQVVAAVLAYQAGFGVFSLQGIEFAPWLSLLVTVAWLVGCSNAFNLIDGLDGLAAGVGLFATLTTLVAALTQGNLELALVTVPLAGSLVGFLRYNFNPASIFLGDSGSLLVGFLLGCYGAVWSQKAATILGITAPLMAMAIPLLDTALSIVRRFLRHQPIFGADNRHIHHRLLAQGFTPRRAALVLYAMCGIAAGLSLLETVLHNQFSGLIVILFCAAAWIGVQHLGYAEFGIAGRLLFQGTLRRIVDVQFRLREFEQAFRAAPAWEQAWQVLRQGARSFGFQGVRIRVLGKTLEDRDPALDSQPSWQLRVPLPDRQYVNFYCDMQTALHPVVLGSFGQTVERVLTARLAEFQQQQEEQHTMSAVVAEVAPASDTVQAAGRG
jgi:UDP-GlcNAc:undecaprenyl-phosphate GlcNAc-1-phosphate transferase